MSYCSNGDRISQAAIDRRYGIALRQKHEGNPRPICEGCLDRLAEHNDHTIAKARCKVIHKAELIWHPGNFVSSCPTCHAQWEAIKGGEWINHANVDQRLKFLKDHDPEGFNIRVELVTLSLQQQCKPNPLTLPIATT